MADTPGGGPVELWARVYRKVHQIAKAEISKELGAGWRNGRLDAAYLIKRIPFTVLPVNADTLTLSIGVNSDAATQHVTYPNPYPATTMPAGATATSNSATVASTAGLWVGQRVRFTQAGGSHLTETHKLTIVDHSTKNITVDAALANSYAAGDAFIVVPHVTLGSGDIGWDATRANVDNTGFDLTLARRVSLTNSEGGAVLDPATGNPPKILAGNTYVDTSPITFPTAYQSAPVVQVQTGDPEYTAVALSITATQFVVRVTHTPTAVSGTIVVTVDKHTTDLTVDPASTGLTVNDYTGNTGDTTANHHHITQVHDYTLTPLATDGQSNEHQHTDTHGHGATDPGHPHGLTEPNSGAGHPHTATATFAGTATAVLSDTTVPCRWIAFGLRTAPAVTKEASWAATTA